MPEIKYNYRTIHETVIKDIIDVMDLLATDGIDKYNDIRKKRSKSFKSITSATKDLILTFPVICSTNISIESANLISKATERKATSMLQILFSAMQISDDGSTDVFDYVKKYHTNISGDIINDPDFINVDDVIRINDKLNEFTEKIYSNGTDVTSLYEASWDKSSEAMLKECLKYSNFVMPESIKKSAINEYKIDKTFNKERFVINEADDEEEDDSEEKTEPKTYYKKSEPNKYSDTKFLSDINKNSSTILKARSDMFKNQLMPGDIKKANELMPTMVQVSFKVPTADGRFIGVEQALIGVKAKLYAITSEDIINRIKLKVKDKDFITSFVRASTNEISFWKDFIFAIDRAKMDALSYSRRGSSSKLWKVLERRALKSKLRRTLGSTNTASAISTLVVSQDEVEYMKKNGYVDLENTEVARTIMESYNFMGICIVDENLEVAKFIYDTGEDNWESLSFGALETENKDNTYKKVINLMSKVR